MLIQTAYTEPMLPEWQFHNSAHQFPVIDIQISDSGSANYQIREVDSGSLLKESLPNPTDDSILSPSFRLVELSRNAENKIKIHRKSFHDLLDGFHIDSEVLRLIRYNVHGFYQIPCGRISSQHQTYYAYTVSHTLMWSFDNTNKSTRAILIASGQGANSDFIRFQNVLDQNRGFAREKLFLLLACAV